MIKTVIFSLFSLVFADTYENEFNGKVVNVIDGNTLEVESKEDGLIQVMLKEVDCPEISQEFGEEAKLFTESLILKKKVTIELRGKDRWGNKLAVVKLKNGKILHEELLKQGLAWSSEKTVLELRDLETKAKENKTGLWIEESPMAPWVYRRKQTMLKPKSMH